MQNLIDNFFAYTITGLTIGAVYALVALGYTLVYGVLRLINFAHSEVFMFGTFAALWVVMFLGGAPGGSVVQVIFWVAMMFVAAMAMSGLIAVLLERVAYRPLRK
ncbi:MAG: inner-rane translocator, partial [Humibacillus sp.]|nr:inner-rane translocator [Humibacillus sp.]